MEKPKHPLHLKNPELQKSPEVAQAVERRERATGEKVPNDPRARLEAYISRWERIVLNPDERVRQRNIEMLRDTIYDALIIKRENVPESYFELQQRIARERGQPVEDIPPETRERMIDTVIEDQKASLDRWMHYLSSNDAMYPAWFKYLVFRNVAHLSQFDKTLGKFKTRTESTVAPFPDIYHEPLAQIADLYESAEKDKTALKDPVARDFFNKKFPALYAEFISRSLAVGMERGEDTRGQWIKYEHGNMEDADRLFDSLQGKGTGWCTSGHATAETQIESGDFYVYYTYDKDGKPSQPRVAIRMEEGRIAEVRGILEHQQLEPQMQEALDEKLKEFGAEADAYRKKSADMKLLTEIEKKTKEGKALARGELVFLYEIDAPIEGFGYEKDPRVEELRASRDVREDMPVIFDAAPEEIAHAPSEITGRTRAYVGALETGIFKKLPADLRHIYTSFPEGRVGFERFAVGGESGAELLAELEAAGDNVYETAEYMLKSRAFEERRLKTPEEATFVRLTVASLGLPRGGTLKEIYDKAGELGLELCPSDAGPRYRLQYRDQPLGEWIRIAMEPISDRDGRPPVFNVVRNGDGLWLGDVWGDPDFRWRPVDSFLFRFRALPSES